jgi:peptidoglycan/xylan/chitin deacetylase (PgdA/CDA1 family)
MSLKYKAIRATFEALWLSRLPGLIRTLSQSRGVILTLHRVLPEPPAAFSPNAILQVQPAFLDYALGRLRGLGVDLVSLDEAIERLRAPARPRPFAVLTFDDGYRDNLTYALPILRKHKAPFTLYLPPALVDGTGEIWWQAIEDIIGSHDAISFTREEKPVRLSTSTLVEKQTAFDTLYWHLRKMPEDQRVDLVRRFAADHGYDLARQCRDLIMTWDELALIAADPLCTIGAHTIHHYELAKLPESEARVEMLRSTDVLEQRFGRRPAHLSYPLGGPLSAGQREFDLARELGFTTAVTTRPGGLYPRHLQTLHALPRISLNGLFQERRYVDVFATGAIFSVMGRLTG